MERRKLDFQCSLRVVSPQIFAHGHVCILPAPQSLSPKLETTRSLIPQLIKHPLHAAKQAMD